MSLKESIESSRAQVDFYSNMARNQTEVGVKKGREALAPNLVKVTACGFLLVGVLLIIICYFSNNLAVMLIGAALAVMGVYMLLPSKKETDEEE